MTASRTKGATNNRHALVMGDVSAGQYKPLNRARLAVLLPALLTF